MAKVRTLGEEEEPQDQSCICAGQDEEFTMANCLLVARNPVDFVKSQWFSTASWFYVIYRVLMALMFLVWCPIDIWYITVNFYHNEAYYWFVYATNWTLVGLALTAVLHATLTITYRVQADAFKHDVDECTPALCGLKLYWMNSVICHNASLVIGICYWGAIMVLPHSDMFNADISKVKHSLLMAYVLWDTFISAYPVRLLHVIYALTCMILYIVFNGVYFAFGGEGPRGEDYIYYQLRWSKTGLSLVTIMFAMMMSILAQLLLYAVFCIRCTIAKHCVSADRPERERLIAEPETETCYNTNEAISGDGA